MADTAVKDTESPEVPPSTHFAARDGPFSLLLAFCQSRKVWLFGLLPIAASLGEDGSALQPCNTQGDFQLTP